GDGTYTAAYRAITAGTDLRAAVRLPGWSAAKQSEAYAITLGDEAPDSINTQVNPYTFSVASEEGTFPSTGFAGATFTIVPKNHAKASDYTWTADAPWVSVTDGVVRFTGKGTGNKVTITGTPRSGQGNIIRYSFALESWFVTDNKKCASKYPYVRDYCHHACDYLPGYSLPTVWQLNQGGVRGNLDGIWSEWGDLSKYPGSNINEKYYWSSSFWVREETFEQYRYYVDVIRGKTNFPSVTDNAVMCRKEL
ncbi:invasin, partial [Kosakonia cowanii]